MVLLLAKIRPTIEGTVVSETVSASANHLLLKVFFDPESATPCSTEHDTVILKTLTPCGLANSAQPKAPADRRCRCGEHRRISSATRRRRGPIRCTAGSTVAS